MKPKQCCRSLLRVFAGSICLMCVGSLPFSTGVENSVAADEKKKAAKLDRPKLLRVFLSEFVEIMPGQGPFPKSFQMGSASGPKSEQPTRMVALDHSFFMAKYEVPQNLYEAVMGRNPSVWGGPRNSVEMLTWQEANLFCQRATKLLRDTELIEATEEIRLPTEAEWEYCCRAGTKTAYSFGEKARMALDTGNKASHLDAWGWHTGNAKGNDPPVGALKPNPWGLYDMHGYLWEFVADAWHENYLGGPVDGNRWGGGRNSTQRVMRGGSWRDRYKLLQSTTRWAIPEHVRSDAIGFRCVKAKVRKASQR